MRKENCAMLAIVVVLICYIALIYGAIGMAQQPPQLPVAALRYPIGDLVPHEVYTWPYEPNEPIYRFVQPPPPDWARQFGNNERTMIIHGISDNRVRLSQVARMVTELQAKVNEWETRAYIDPNVINIRRFIPDPNEAKE